MRVFVTGHRGLVGSAVCRRLREAGHEVLTAGQVDLTQSDSAFVLDQLWSDEPPDAMVMCAAYVGGIAENVARGRLFLQQNLRIQDTCFRYASMNKLERLVFLGSVCVYPRGATRPITEDALLTGPFEPTNRPYALAKIVGIETVNLERASGSTGWVSLMPSNIYGPGDNFNLATAHALPALLHKAMTLHHGQWAHAPSRRPALHVWGNPETYREQMYVDDLADAITFILQQKTLEHGVYNVGSGVGASIGTLARMILEVAGLDNHTEIVFDKDRPVGAPERILDSWRIRALGWAPKTGLLQGLSWTWRWMLAHHSEMRV